MKTQTIHITPRWAFIAPVPSLGVFVLGEVMEDKRHDRKLINEMVKQFVTGCPNCGHSPSPFDDELDDNGCALSYICDECFYYEFRVVYDHEKHLKNWSSQWHM